LWALHHCFTVPAFPFPLVCLNTPGRNSFRKTCTGTLFSRQTRRCGRLAKGFGSGVSDDTEVFLQTPGLSQYQLSRRSWVLVGSVSTLLISVSVYASVPASGESLFKSPSNFTCDVLFTYHEGWYKGHGNRLRIRGDWRAFGSTRITGCLMFYS